MTPITSLLLNDSFILHLSHIKFGFYIRFGKTNVKEILERSWTTRKIRRDFPDNKTKKSKRTGWNLSIFWINTCRFFLIISIYFYLSNNQLVSKITVSTATFELEILITSMALSSEIGIMMVVKPCLYNRR